MSSTVCSFGILTRRHSIRFDFRFTLSMTRIRLLYSGETVFRDFIHDGADNTVFSLAFLFGSCVCVCVECRFCAICCCRFMHWAAETRTHNSFKWNARNNHYWWWIQFQSNRPRTSNRKHTKITTEWKKANRKKRRKSKISRSLGEFTHSPNWNSEWRRRCGKWKDKSHNDVYDFHSLCVFSAGTLHVRPDQNAMLRRACSNNNKYTLLVRNHAHTREYAACV